MAVRFRKCIQLAPGGRGDLAGGRPLDRIHEGTPDPRALPRFQAPKFAEPRPAAPTARRASWWARIVPGSTTRIARDNQRAAVLHDEDMQDWLTAKRAHDQAVARRRARFESELRRDPSAMESGLEMALHAVPWPHATEVGFETRKGGALVMLDVGIEAPAGARLQAMAMAQVHGIAFRLVGESFAALPAAREVVLSAYAQRRGATTAEVDDACLLSVRVDRLDWQTLDFARLPDLDVVEALARFELRRAISPSGEFKAISPLEA